MKNWLDLNVFLGVSATHWLHAALAFLISYFVLLCILKFAIARLTALSIKTSTHLDNMAVEVLKSTRRFTIVLAALLVGAQFLDLPEKWGSRIDQLWFLVIGVQIALWVNRSVTIWTAMRLNGSDTARNNPVITTMMSWGLRALLWSVLLLAILANMGVNITAFVASLGVGGVAIALAVQSILSDLFASAAIGLDKPFETGDFIVFGSVAGSIEHIGLKTTRIRSISGEQIVCSNTDLLKNTIRNFKRMTERRILFTFGVTYDVSPEKLKRIPEIVKRSVEAAGNTRFDRAHMKGFGESSLDFEVVYYITDPSYNLFMDIQQKVNLELIEEFAGNEIGFAFPTRTIHIASPAAA